MRFIEIKNYDGIRIFNRNNIIRYQNSDFIKPIQSHLLLRNNKLWSKTCSHKGLLIEDNGRYHFIAFTKWEKSVEELYSLSSILLDQKITTNEYSCVYPNVIWDLGIIGDSESKLVFEDVSMADVNKYFYTEANFNNFKEKIELSNLEINNISPFLKLELVLEEIKEYNKIKKDPNEL